MAVREEMDKELRAEIYEKVKKFKLSESVVSFTGELLKDNCDAETNHLKYHGARIKAIKDMLDEQVSDVDIYGIAREKIDGLSDILAEEKEEFRRVTKEVRLLCGPAKEGSVL